MTRLGLIVVVVVAGAVAHLAQRRLDAMTAVPDTVAEVFPAPVALRVMSLGQPTLVADYYWLRAIEHYGTRRMHELGYPNLVPILERALAMDPKFAGGYRFADTALTTARASGARAAAVFLEQGWRERPDDWLIGFYLGFNSYHYLKDYARAAQVLSEAAKLPGAPPQVAQLASVIAVRAQQPEVGLQMVDTMLATLDSDDPLRADYEQRKRLLLIELHLNWIDAAIERYRSEHGAPPTQIEQLIAPGLFTELPEEPLGGRYLIDAEGRAVSSNDALRLKFYEARDRPAADSKGAKQ